MSIFGFQRNRVGRCLGAEPQNRKNLVLFRRTLHCAHPGPLPAGGKCLRMCLFCHPSGARSSVTSVTVTCNGSGKNGHELVHHASWVTVLLRRRDAVATRNPSIIQSRL